jgi:hypothetical protein
MWYNIENELRGRPMLNCSYENFLLCQILWIGYQDGSISSEDIKQVLVNLMGEKNFEKMLKKFEKTLDKSNQM